MPYIDAKITGTVTQTQRETLKNQLGQAIALLKKPESFLMIGQGHRNLPAAVGHPAEKPVCLLSRHPGLGLEWEEFLENNGRNGLVDESAGPFLANMFSVHDPLVIKYLI